MIDFETRINRSFMRDYDSMKEKFLRKEEPIKVDQSLMTDFDTMEETAHVTEEQIIDIRGSGAFHKTINKYIIAYECHNNALRM
jgi:3-mercaptopyruvate sulfurtransferase SseA